MATHDTRRRPHTCRTVTVRLEVSSRLVRLPYVSYGSYGCRTSRHVIQGEQRVAHHLALLRPEPRTGLQHDRQLRIWIELGDLRGDLASYLANRLGDLVRCDLIVCGAR